MGRGSDWGEIAKEVGKSRGSCMKKASDLMLEKNQKRGWSNEEVQILVQLKEEGVSYRKIANQLGRTYGAVRKHYIRVREGEMR